MRRLILSLCGICVLPAIACVPAAGQSSAATQPAVVSAPSSPPPIVLVLPIRAPASGGFGWVGTAIQRDLVADFSQAARVRAIGPASLPPAADAQDALRSGRQQGARYVVYADAQVSGNSLRVTGQMLDVATARPMAGLKATAPVDDLFPLEDALAGQALSGLPRELVYAPPTPATPPAPPPGENYQSYTYTPSLPQGNTNYLPEYFSYQQSEPYGYYGPDYYDPYYTNWGYWGYPWWGPDVLIFGRYDHDDFHHHHFDGDWRGGYYSRPGAGGFGRYGSGSRGSFGVHPGYGGGGRGGGGGAHGGG